MIIIFIIPPITRRKMSKRQIETNDIHQYDNNANTSSPILPAKDEKRCHGEYGNNSRYYIYQEL